MFFYNFLSTWSKMCTCRLRKPDYEREDFDVDPVDPTEDAIAELGSCFKLERQLRSKKFEELEASFLCAINICLHQL